MVKIVSLCVTMCFLKALYKYELINTYSTEYTLTLFFICELPLTLLLEQSTQTNAKNSL